jgi:predicted amidohydrolase
MAVGEFLSVLLDEYEDIANEHTEIRVVRSNELTEKIKRSLEQVNSLPTAIKWYNEDIPERDKTIARGYYLGCLLERIDKLYSEKPIIRLQTPDKNIVLGRRWWNVYGYINSENLEKPLERPAFSVHSLFPHIRKVRLNDEEWFIDKIIERAFERVKEDGVLKFGLCSLTGRSKTQFVGTKVLQSSVFGFYAASVEYDPIYSDRSICQNGYIQELSECIQWARENNVHILCFPELSICSDGREAIRAEIETNPGHICLIIPGSYHNQVTGTNDLFTNSAPIWIVNNGKITELTIFDKTEPFSMDVSKAKDFNNMSDVIKKADEKGCKYIEEHIQPGNMIRVLSTPIGIIGIAICKDLLANKDLIERYNIIVDHLIVVSMNFSSAAWFWTESEISVRANCGAMFYVNASQVVEPENTDVDMVFWHIPCQLFKDNPSKNKERYFRQKPSNSQHYQLPEDGRVCFEIKIPSEMLK